MIVSKMKVFIEQTDSLTRQQQLSLDLLYAPLLSLSAYRLYNLCLSLGQLNIILDYSMLTNFLDMKLDDIETARQTCESLWLIETYQKDNDHYLRIKPPLDYHQFKNHKILGRLFIKQIDSESLNTIVGLLSGRRFFDEGENISATLDTSALSNFKKEQEADYQAVVASQQTNAFDMKLLINLCGEVIFPKHLQTTSTLSFIEGYAKAYKIPYKRLKEYINDSIDIEQSQFDIDQFKKLASINHQPLPKGDPMKWPSEKFLAYRQNGIQVIQSDLNLIRDLKEKYQFSNEVINILIDYVLTQHNGSFARSLVEKIATSWVRAKLDTPEKIKQYLSSGQKPKQQENKKVVRIKKADDSKPEDVTLDPQAKADLLSKLKE